MSKSGEFSFLKDTNKLHGIKEERKFHIMNTHLVDKNPEY